MMQAKEKSFQKAKTAVYRLLKLRLYSEQEIREKLKRKRFDDSIIDQTILYFKDVELIDDRIFAQKWISSRLAKPFGIHRIKAELKNKGITPDILQDELSHAAENFPEANIALALAKKRAAQYKNVEQTKMKQRLQWYLLRRGFSPGAVSNAVKNI